MTKFGINISPITGKVYIGKINKKGTERLDKEEVKGFEGVIADYLYLKFRELGTDQINLSVGKGTNITMKLVVDGVVTAS